MKTKILKNVFLNTTGNFVVPVYIYFTDSIKEIYRLLPEEIDWSDIDTIPKKEQIIKKIKSVSHPTNAEIIDGNFDVVIPGAIDPHVHFNTPGFEDRDDFEHGSTAAAFGGVTAIIDMPCTSLPPVTSLKNFENKLNTVNKRSLIDFAFWGGVCRNDFGNIKTVEKNIKELDEAGVASYKAYLISGMQTFQDLNIEQMNTAANLISKTGKPLGVHAEDKKLIEFRREKFRNAQQDAWKNYCIARDAVAEQIAVNDMVNIAKRTEAKTHIVHLSSKLGLDSIIKAQENGIRITAETCSQYLHFTQDDFNNSLIRNFLKTAPPVKEDNDRIALWEGIKNNKLIFVTTDHAGCDPSKEKSSDNFWEVYGGIPGVEHRVPHLISEGFKKNKISLNQTIKLLSTNAAEYFNLKNKGKIEIGYHADFAIINMWESESVKSEKMHSKGKYTPFEGFKFECSVKKTILRGNVVMDKSKNKFGQIGYGKFIEVN